VAPAGAAGSVWVKDGAGSVFVAAVRATCGGSGTDGESCCSHAGIGGDRDQARWRSGGGGMVRSSGSIRIPQLGQRGRLAVSGPRAERKQTGQQNSIIRLWESASIISII